MDAVRIHTKLTSDTLRHPKLKRFKGKRVEITVREEKQTEQKPERFHGRKRKTVGELWGANPVLADPKLWEGFDEWLKSERKLRGKIRDLPE